MRKESWLESKNDRREKRKGKSQESDSPVGLFQNILCAFQGRDS